MKIRFSLLLGVLLALSAPALTGQQTLERAGQLEVQGRFKEAGALLKDALKAPPAGSPSRAELEFELDRLSRIRQDFPFTEKALYAELSKSVQGLTRAEFNQWLKEKRFDFRDIDGRRYYMVSSVSNLFFRYQELATRRIPPKEGATLAQARLESCRAISAAAAAAKVPYVLSKRFRVTMTVSAEPGAAPDGELISAWLPIPRRYPFQSGFELLSTSSPVKHLDDESSPIRSLQLEQPAHKHQPTRFQVEYAYTAQGVRFDLGPAASNTSPVAVTPELAPFLAEGPHIVFSPELRALSRQLAGEETNPCRKARKFFDWISDNIKYSYAIEYSTIRNISDYCRSHGYGDCGQEALLFIALCRLNGIPARWQSGWNTFPGAKSIHDWSEIYLEPCGWVPVDPYMGIYAMRYATTLPEAEREEIRDFYFGGLDQYRMIANRDHNQKLTPPKKSMRSDNVDFQRGELEWGEHNIYFDQYTYDLTINEIEPKP